MEDEQKRKYEVIVDRNTLDNMVEIDNRNGRCTKEGKRNIVVDRNTLDNRKQIQQKLTIEKEDGKEVNSHS